MFGESHTFIDLNVDESLSLPEALDDICAQAERGVRDGKLIVMLSDRYLEKGKLPHFIHGVFGIVCHGHIGHSRAGGRAIAVLQDRGVGRPVRTQRAGLLHAPTRSPA